MNKVVSIGNQGFDSIRAFFPISMLEEQICLKDFIFGMRKNTADCRVNIR